MILFPQPHRPMMPSIIAESFFDDPYDILSFAHSLEYIPSLEGRWPGVRNIDNPSPQWGAFVEYLKTCLQRQSVFNHTNPDNLLLVPKFQLIHPLGLGKNDLGNKGFIHHDFAPFPSPDPSHQGAHVLATAMVYLNSVKSDYYGGTALFTIKHGIEEPYLGLDIKWDYLKNNQGKKHVEFNQRVQHHWNQFDELLDCPHRFNRMFVFDARQWHGVKFISYDVIEPRITLVIFIGVKP